MSTLKNSMNKVMELGEKATVSILETAQKKTYQIGENDG